MFCPKCGCNLENGTRFCTECGTDVTLTQPVQAPAPTPTAAPVQTPAPSPVPYNVQPQPQPQQHTYQAPPPPQYNYNQYQPQQPNIVPLDKPLTTWQYVGMFLLCAIPIVGIVLIFMWAFGSNVNINKQNYARALLIMALIGIVLSIIFSLLLGSILTSIFRFTYSLPMN